MQHYLCERITSANCLNEVFNYDELRERGRQDKKFHWAIEMNHASWMYISTYNGVDVADHNIKKWNIYYRTWKYWHSPKHHAFVLAIVVAYDMYKECCEGKFDFEWECAPISFWDFRHILSMQQLQYSPTKCMYPGDDRMRANTKLNKKKQSLSKRGEIPVSKFKKQRLLKTGRCCGDLDKLTHHAEKVITLKRGKICGYCGETTYKVCGICCDEKGSPIPLHYNSKDPKGNTKWLMCFNHYHNDNQFGLAKNDAVMMKTTKKDWYTPSTSNLKEHKEYVQDIIKKASL